MSNMFLFTSMRAGRSSSYSNRYEEGEYQELEPTMLTIKPAYRWALRVFAGIIAIVVAVGNILAEEHILLKIASVVIMALMVWFAFAQTEDALVYKVKQVMRNTPESMV